MNNPNEPMKGCRKYPVRIDGRTELIEAETAQEAQDLAKSVEPLYAVYMSPAQELLAAPSRDAASHYAENYNRAVWTDARDPSRFYAQMVRYPGTPKSHAEEVKRWEEA